MFTKLTFSKTQYMNAIKQPLTPVFGKAANDNSEEIKLSRESDAAKRAYREMGNRVGELAQACFPDGIDVPVDPSDIPGCEQTTRDLIDAGEEIIFEATAINPKNGTYAMLDVLRKVEGTDEWDMIEVKSGTKVKPEYTDDLAFQRYVFEGAGYKIRNCYLMYVDTSYVAGPEIDPHKFFKMEDVTKAVARKQQYVDRNVIRLIAHRDGKPHVDKEALAKFLDKIEYPVYHLDYETVNAAIPLYEGTNPYQQVPFQFSLHIQDEPGGELRHVSFLYKDTDDPRRDLAEALVKHCGNKGSVIVYFQEFEENRNKELAAEFPDLAKQIREINRRMIDIFEPFQKCWLYDPAQEGSASLKVVLPTYTDISYDDMTIGNGRQALDEYLAFVTGNKTDPQELEELWEGLEEYCGQDTYAMVELLDVLYEKAGIPHKKTPKPQQQSAQPKPANEP